MRILKVLLAGAAVVVASPTFADNTDTANIDVTGKIVAPLVIQTNGAMVMPHLVKPKMTMANGNASPSGGTTWVALKCGNTDTTNAVQWNPGGTPFADGNAYTDSYGGPSGPTAVPKSYNSENRKALGTDIIGKCAEVTVTGESNYYFTISTSVTAQPTNAGLTLSDPYCYHNGGFRISNGATVQLQNDTKMIRCGALVTADMTAVAGDYAGGKIAVTVTYD